MLTIKQNIFTDQYTNSYKQGKVYFFLETTKQRAIL